MNADVTEFVGRATVERVNSHATPTVSRLQVFNDGLQDIHFEHPSAILLTDGTGSTVLVDNVVMDPMAWEETIEIGAVFPYSTVFSIHHMSLDQKVIEGSFNWKVFNRPHKKCVEFEGTR